jgi:hypothetical protein
MLAHSDSLHAKIKSLPPLPSLPPKWNTSGGFVEDLWKSFDPKWKTWKTFQKSFLLQTTWGVFLFATTHIFSEG